MAPVNVMAPTFNERATPAAGAAMLNVPPFIVKFCSLIVVCEPERVIPWLPPVMVN